MSKKISELDPLPSALESGDVFPVVRGGANYKAKTEDIPNNSGLAFSKTISADSPQFGTTFDEVQIQAALDYAVANNYQTVVINEDYIFNRFVEVPSNINIEVNGTLKVTDTVVYNMSTDNGLITSETKTVPTGTYPRTDNRDYLLNSVTGLMVGQYVSLFDDRAPKMFVPHTNRRANMAQIVAINGNTITIDRDIANELNGTAIGEYMFLVSSNARVVPCNGIFRVDNKDNVRIYGQGTLDCNRPSDDGVIDVPNDPNNEMFNDEDSEEDYTIGVGCTVAVLNNSTNFIIDGLKVINGYLHNFRLREVYGFEVKNCYVDNAHDKNLLVHYCSDGLIDNNKVINSLFEDGIILYIDVENTVVSNNFIGANPRYGLAVQARCKGVRTFNNTMEYNGVNYFNNCPQGLSSTNDYLLGGRMAAYRTPTHFETNISLQCLGRSATFNNLVIFYPYDKSTVSYPEASGWKPMVFYDTIGNDVGVSKGIVFNGGGIINGWCRPRSLTTMIYEGDEQNLTNMITYGGAGNGIDKTADGIQFNGFTFDGIAKGLLFNRPIGDGLAFTSLRFNQCVFKNSFLSSLFEIDVLPQDEAAVEFINCDDYITGSYNGGVIVNGQFVTDSDWSKGVGWSINTVEQRAECDGSAGASSTLLAQSGILTIGETYKVSYTVEDYVSGTIKARCGFSGQATARNGNGIFIEDVVCSGNTNFDLIGTSTFIGNIKNVSAILL